VLLDASGGTLGRNITNERGQYRIARSSGMTRMRVLRIGFRPREVQLPRATDSVVPLDIAMQSLPTMLEPVRVSADSKCPRRSDDARTYALLEQVRAGLLSIVVARDANPATLVRLVFERRMDGSSDRIASQTVQMDSITAATTSFGAAHAATDFVQRGFMRDSAQQSIFFGPDADVLLDDGFALGYCFRIIQAGRERTNQVGLAFSAGDRRPGRIDIDGALWVDTLARALRDIEFRYVGLARTIEALRPGGRVAFREMPNGMVLIDQWSLRLIGAVQDTVEARGKDEIRTWYHASEDGGEVARAQWPDGSTVARVAWNTSRSGRHVGGTVPLREHPCVSPTRRTQASPDSAGVIEISDLVPGPYSLAIIDARLASIALDVPTPGQVCRRTRFDGARGDCRPYGERLRNRAMHGRQTLRGGQLGANDRESNATEWRARRGHQDQPCGDWCRCGETATAELYDRHGRNLSVLSRHVPAWNAGPGWRVSRRFAGPRHDGASRLTTSP
jgi:hypothetical protein